MKEVEMMENIIFNSNLNKTERLYLRNLAKDHDNLRDKVIYLSEKLHQFEREKSLIDFSKKCEIILQKINNNTSIIIEKLEAKNNEN